MLPWLDLLEMLRDWSPGAIEGGAARDRHEQAWNEVDRRLRLFAAAKLAQNLGLTREDVEDVTQSSLLKLQSNTVWRRLRTADSIVGYLLVIVRNQAMDVARRRSAEQKTLLQLPSESLSYPTRESEDATVSIERLRSAVNSLSPDERRLVDLRFWKGMRLDEISHCLHLPYSTVAGRMVRLLNKLQQEMQKIP